MRKIGYFLAFLVIQAYACPGGVATTSVYFLPDAKDLCGAYGKRCKKFMAEVEMQGSGKLYPNKVIRYNSSKVKDLPAGCETTTGASGQCQLAYLSIAADPRHYNMGDIINMPGLKGKKVTRKNGTTFVHPGYLIVHDVGGAIKGTNRFDLFADVGLFDSKNIYGYKADQDLKLYHEETCSSLKKFTRIKPTHSTYAAALKAIESVSPSKASKSPESNPAIEKGKGNQS